MTFLLFTLFWFLVVPPATARLAKTIAHERVFAGLRAYVEARFPNTLLDYLIGCPLCQTYWIVLAFALLTYPFEWTVARMTCGPLTPLVLLVYWLATVELAIEWWLRPNREPQD